MPKIKAEHYTDMLIYSIEQTIKDIKADLNQYISTLEPDITAEQFAVLDTIYTHKDICASDLATILSKAKSNIKRIIEILEKNDFIESKLGRKNNRLVNYLKITKKGKEVVDKNINSIKKYLENKFCDIEDSEIEILERIIKKLKK